MKAKKAKKIKGDFVNCLSIKPNYCAEYVRYIPTEEERQDRALPIKNTADGKMSRAARGRLMNAINWMVLFSPKKFVYRKPPKKSFYFKVNFLTVTLSDAQFHTDEFIKSRMLEPLLKWMKRQHNCLNYVWRAETQQNGNIHFHITTNKYIWIKSLQNKWNSLQREHGYLKHYFAKYGTHDAPSTDIKAVKNTKELAIYMGKYFAKDRPERQPEPLTMMDKFSRGEYFDLQMWSIAASTIDNLRRAVEGKQWACSTSLTKLSINMWEGDADYYNEKNDWIMMHATDKRKTDYATIYTTKWDMNSNAPVGIAKRIMELHNRFNEGDDNRMRYEEPTEEMTQS